MKKVMLLSLLSVLITPVVAEQEMAVEAAINGDRNRAFDAFCQDAHVQLPLCDARAVQ